MPTYDYKCKSCQHIFEHFQSMSSDPLKKCPECEKDSLQRLIGKGAAIIFKGSGFYQTDYKSTKRSNKSKNVSKTDAPKDVSKTNAPKD